MELGGGAEGDRSTAAAVDNLLKQEQAMFGDEKHNVCFKQALYRREWLKVITHNRPLNTIEYFNTAFAFAFDHMPHNIGLFQLALFHAFK